MKPVAVEDFYERFCDESFDKHGVLKTFRPIYEENFNFAYDVVDEIARLEPNRRAMVWCNDQGEEKIFTFDDMRRYSNKAANLFVKYGIKKGDMVKVIAGKDKDKEGKVIAVDHKNGRVTVEGVNMLTKHTKPSMTNQNGGIVHQEGSIDISNVMYLHKGKATRVGIKMDGDKKVRFAKSTGEVID